MLPRIHRSRTWPSMPLAGSYTVPPVMRMRLDAMRLGCLGCLECLECLECLGCLECLKCLGA